MKALWRGGISFGLVNIPVRLYSGSVTHRIDLDMIRKKDQCAIQYVRVCKKDGKEVRRGLDPGDTRKISDALQNNWVITFPQGTTKPFAPGRKGTAFIIKHHKPIVIPVVINGFWRAFNKRGLKFKKKGTILSVRFKEPLNFTYEESVEEILETIMDAIEQSEKFMWLRKGAKSQE